MSTKAISGARIFDGSRWHDDAALLVSDGSVVAIQSAASLPDGCEIVDAGGGILVPGFIDLQVNGGGGAMLNDEPTVEGIATICRAHAKFGSTGLLPTLITDTREITAAVIAAGKQAMRQGVPGFLGLHLEGPHLSIARKGAHDPALIRPMDEDDLALMLSCAGVFEAMMVTVAPENVTLQQVETLARAGFTVSLGHT